MDCGGKSCGEVGTWDVSLVTNMSYMFWEAAIFDQNIDSWNVSAVTTMFAMFAYTKAFNQDIGSWDVSAVTTMRSMFYEAAAFDQDIGSWDVSGVTVMMGMFNRAAAFNQNIHSWDVSRVTTMENMFYFAAAFNQRIYSWNVSAVTDMRRMFNGATTYNQNMNSWDVSSVTDMSYMFSYAKAYNQNIDSWDVSRVTTMNRMFLQARSFNQKISLWDVSPGLKDTYRMFVGARSYLSSHTNCGWPGNFGASMCGSADAYSISQEATDGPPRAWLGPQSLFGAYVIDFEPGAGSAALFEKCWSHDQAGDFDWTLHSGSTTSSSTGPNAAHSHDHYLYAEASGSNRDEEEAIITMHCDVNTLYSSSPQLRFYYLMHGANIGSLYVEVYTSQTGISSAAKAWTILWEKSEQTHTTGRGWSMATVALPREAALKIRFRAKLGHRKNGHVYKGDIAIDTVRWNPVIFCHVSSSTQRVLHASCFTCTVCF